MKVRYFNELFISTEYNIHTTAHNIILSIWRSLLILDALGREVALKATIHEEILFPEAVSGDNVSSCMIRCFHDVPLFRISGNCFQRIDSRSIPWKHSFHEDQRSCRSHDARSAR